MQLKLKRLRHLTRHRSDSAVVISLLVTTLVLGLHFSGWLERVEWITYDARMRFHRADQPPHPDVAMVLIDDASLQAMDPLVGRWPWPRSVYADLLEFMAMGGAEAVIFDLLFAEREEAAQDEALIQYSAASGIAYHAVQFLKESTEEIGAEYLNRPLPGEFVQYHALPALLPDTGNNSFLLPIDGLYQAARGVGVVGIDADSDGIFRRGRLFATYGGRAFPALSMAALVPRLGSRISFDMDGTPRVNGNPVPLDKNGYYLFNMVGDFKPYSISGIFASIQKMRSGEVGDMMVYPDEFEGKIVFVGGSAIGLEDIKTTPLSTKTPGVFIHASATSNFLTGNILQPVATWSTLLIMASFATLTVTAVLLSQRLTVQYMVPPVLALGWVGFAVWQFGNLHIYNVTTPLAGVAMALLSAYGYLVFTEGKDKRRVRNMLAQYVSPAMLSEVLNSYEEQLKAEVGSSEHLSILFSDVRSFTSISEQLNAEQVVEILNTHFSVMTEIIFRYQGTLDKFIGDAIMAFWGAPIKVENHADLAVQAALEMSRGLEQVNAQLAPKGYPELRVGIGINSGDVILGNIGSERKLDYTVIGDNVNLASRMEGLTSKYGCPVLISESTRRELKQELPCVLVDMVRVKGKTQPIRIYWPVAHLDDAPAVLAQGRDFAVLADEAFAHYEARRWEEAIACYERFPEGTLRNTFVQRCREYQHTPPPEDWDGVFTLTSK